MDRAISASDANQHFSEMLRDVQSGDSFVVLARGRPVARVVPVDVRDQSKAIDALLGKLATLPERSAPNWQRDDLYP